MKAAAYIASVFAVCKDAPLDMLMFYDARPGSSMNALVVQSDGSAVLRMMPWSFALIEY